MATIRKTKSGSYEVQIRHAGLPSISRTLPTKKLATAFAREVEGDTKLQLALGRPVSRLIKFNKLSNEYADSYTGKDIDSVIRFNKFWKEKFSDISALNITPLMIDDILLEIAQKRTGSTVNRYKAYLSSCFKYLINQYKKQLPEGFRNPVKDDFVSKFNEVKPRNRHLSAKERIDLFNACKDSEWSKLHLMVLMALTTGARQGELLGLTWQDIDLRLEKAFLHDSKNSEPRILPLTPPVITGLREIQGIGMAKVFDIPYHILDHHFKKALKQAEITNFRFHDLRHSTASFLLENGKSLAQIGEVLGHKSHQSSKRYSHLSIESKTTLVQEVFGEMQ